MRFPCALLVALGLGLSVSMSAQSATLHQAVSDGKIDARCQARGYTSASLALTNKTAEPIAVELLGSYLEPLRRGTDQPDHGVQPLAIAFTRGSSPVREVVIDPGKRWEGVLRTFCMRQGAAAPRASTPMRVAATPCPPLVVKMLDYWHANPKISQDTVQGAVWQVMNLPPALRATTSEAAMKMLGQHRSELVRHLTARIGMAVTEDGQLFFAKGRLADLRQLGVEVPEVGDSLLVALPGKEQETTLAPHTLASGGTLKPRRYLSGAGQLFATASAGLHRYVPDEKHWVLEAPIVDVTAVVGAADGPWYLLTQAGTLHHKDKPTSDWKAVSGRYASIVFAPTVGLMALDRRTGSFVRRAGSRWKTVMKAGTRSRYVATDGKLYRHSRTTGALEVLGKRKRWRTVVKRGVVDVWAGKTHLYWVNGDGQLWVDWDEAARPRMIEPRVGTYFAVAIRPGKDHLYVKTRAHLVIVYDPKHDQ